MASRDLSDEYTSLLNDLSLIVESVEGLFGAFTQADHRRVALYWQMGRRIVDVVQMGQERGAYAQKVLQQLSFDLSQKYGRGFKERTVQYIRRFALQYPEDVPRSGLGWSQYRVLINIDDTDLRKVLEQRAIDEKLTKDQLLALVSKGTRETSDASVYPLEPRNASLGIYKIVLDTVTRKPWLDLGFNVTRELQMKRERNWQNGEFVQLKGNDRVAAIACKPGARYCYSGEVVKVIDGDTVKMRIHLGFAARIDETMRLRGVDAAEIDTEEGKKAHRALSRMLKGATEITVFTYSHDRYGRYIADLIVDGKYINKTLVESGAARFLKM